MNDNEIQNELESIKKLLILQLIRDGTPHAVVAKAAGMSTKTLYKFIPKNLSKINNEEEENSNE
ncbi:MAG: helix-turn-helix domain-containing protein [Nitrosarchaeum sp.]